MKYITSALAACFFFSQMHASTQDELARGYSIQYEATISSSTLWRNSDGKECEYVFTLSDGTRWMTGDPEHFQNIEKAGWSIGDHLTIRLTEDCWLAQNQERKHETPLLQICNKGADRSH